ncbi:MAG: type II secretion system F family protein, partial [Planctomycetota bacterium]
LSLLQDSELGLVRVGEQTGALSEALRKVEAFYADDVARGRTRLVSLVTGGLYAVVLILVASSVIGFYSRYLAQLR